MKLSPQSDNIPQPSKCTDGLNMSLRVADGAPSDIFMLLNSSAVQIYR